MNAKIELVPLGNKIKATIYGQPYCTRMQANLPKSFILELNDLALKDIFGNLKVAKKFAGSSKSITKVVDVTKVFGFDSCDIVK